jgi:hypothetical protein
MDLAMVVADPLGFYDQLSLFEIPYIWKYNQQHPSSFWDKSIGFFVFW